MTEKPLCFGEFELDGSGTVLLLRGAPVKIQPKPLALLVHLVRNRERVVSKQELIAEIWPGVFVSDLALWSALRDLRRSLGDTDTADRTIRTVRGQGLRFVAHVASDASATAAASPLAPRPAAPAPVTAESAFVDREDAMATLGASLAAAARGEMRVSFIAGPAGIGKTRLAAELAREAQQRGFDAWTGRCFDREGAAAFSPWLEIMRALLTSERTAAATQEVRSKLPELAFVADSAPPGAPSERSALDRAEVRLRFFDAFALLLQRSGKLQPLLLFVDDLHWADEASLLLLEFVMGALAGTRIHLVTAFRDAPRPDHTLARVLATAARHPFTERIDLHGLRHGAVSLLLENAAATTPAKAVVDAVLAATAGNALFVSELAKLAAKGQLDVTEFEHGLPIPQRVRDVLRWQFDQLSPSCRSVLQLLSVVGSELDLAVLSRAAGAPQRVVLESLSGAEAVGLVRAGHEHTVRFAFVHDLVRESIYRDLSSAERTRLHWRMAEALAATTLANPAADLGQVAYHYALGAADGAPERAVHFCRMAGQQANARMAYEDAVEHYERALRTLPLLGEPDPKVACELLLAQAEAAWGTSESAAAVQERFVRAADAARRAGAPELFARAALGRSGHGAGPGDFRNVLVVDEVDIALLSEAQAALGSAETELRALVLARLALALRYARPFAVADQLSAEAARIAEGLSANETLAEVLRYRHEVLSGPEFAHERVALAERILTLARSVHSVRLEIDALNFQTRDYFKVLDFTRAGIATAAVETLERTMKHPGMLFKSGIRAVFLLMLHGRFDDAQRSARLYYDRDIGRNMGAQSTFDAQMGMLCSLRGDHDGAIAFFSAIGEQGPNVGWVECAVTRELAFAGRHVEARRLLEAIAGAGYRRLTEHYELALLGSYLMLADACAELGDLKRAAELYERMLPFENLFVVPFLSAVWQGTAAHALGVLAATLRRWTAAECHFEKALAIGRALRSPPLVAVTRQCHGAMLLRRGRATERKRGRALLARAAVIAERTGMRGVLRRCMDCQVAPHEDRDRRPSEPPDL